MKDREFPIITATLLALVVAGAVALSIGATVSVWLECRAEHSWLFCMTVLGGK